MSNLHPAATFTKMQAAGNDFIVVNDMSRKFTSPDRVAVKLCHRQFGIGADGLILLQPARNGQAAYRMRIINSDGSEAEMCGNGSRCAVKFAVETGIAPASHVMETIAGKISGKYISKNQVRVQLTEPSGFRPRVDAPLPCCGVTVRGSFINTGVPHFVTFVKRLDAVDVNGFGAEIRHHKVFAPKGTNVNFVQILNRRRGRSAIRVRTYERGVESETLACGTGATASAIIAALTQKLQPPVSVQTSGGAVLIVDFQKIAADCVTRVSMQGPVEKVFETRMNP